MRQLIKVLAFCFTFMILLFLTSCNRIDKTKFEGAYKSAKAIEGAANVNMTYAQFGQLLQNFSTEVTILKDKINAKNPSEGQAYKLYEEALNAYSASFKLWDEKIELERQDITADDIMSGSYGVVCGYDAPGLDEECNLYKKYGVEITKKTEKPSSETSSTVPGMTYQKQETSLIIKAPEAGIHQIWTYAQGKVAEAQTIIAK